MTSRPSQPTLSDVADVENLRRAFLRARRGKRSRPEVAAFEWNLEPELFSLRDRLLSGSWRCGPFHTFQVRDPVSRRISAAPFADRVVHQALCARIEPLLDAEFVPQSFACRRGKGTHRALRAASYWTRRHAYVLHLDVRKFFPSVDHERLKDLLRERITDVGVLDLCYRIIDGSNPQEPVHDYFPGDDLFAPFERRRGLPIGNLTSQLFGNLMLHPADRWVLDEARCTAYVRYADDMLVFKDDRTHLNDVAAGLREKLGTLRLRPHPRKTQIHSTAAGFPFLGFVIFPDHRRLVGSRLRCAKRRLRRRARQYSRGEIGLSDVTRSVRGWIAHAEHGDTYRLRTRIFRDLVLVREAGRDR